MPVRLAAARRAQRDRVGRPAAWRSPSASRWRPACRWTSPQPARRRRRRRRCSTRNSTTATTARTPAISSAPPIRDAAGGGVVAARAPRCRPRGPGRGRGRGQRRGGGVAAVCAPRSGISGSRLRRDVLRGAPPRRSPRRGRGRLGQQPARRLGVGGRLLAEQVVGERAGDLARQPVVARERGEARVRARAHGVDRDPEQRRDLVVGAPLLQHERDDGALVGGERLERAHRPPIKVRRV